MSSGGGSGGGFVDGVLVHFGYAVQGFFDAFAWPSALITTYTYAPPFQSLLSLVSLSGRFPFFSFDGFGGFAGGGGFFNRTNAIDLEMLIFCVLILLGL